MPIQNVSCSINNNCKFNPPKVKKNTFESFVPQNSLYPQIPLNVSKAYTTPQLYPEYKVLETFKFPNTGVGKVYQLRNGHKVIILPKKGPTVINTYVGAGFNNKNTDKREVAHLLEHLLSDSNYKKDRNHIITIEKLGVDYNAETTNFCTNYYLKAPIFNKNELEELIKIQSNVLLAPNYDEKNVNTEKNIITQEKYLKKDEKSDLALIYEASIKALFNINEKFNKLLPFVNNFDAEFTNHISKRDIDDFYKQYYVSNNLITTIIGNVDDNTIKTFSKYFGKHKSSLMPKIQDNADYFINQAIQESKRVDIRGNGDTKQISLNILKEFPNTSKEQAIVTLANDLLISRFMKNTISDNSFGFVFSTQLTKNHYLMNYKLSSFSTENIEKDVEKLYKIINTILTQEINSQELEKIKENYKSPFKTEDTLALSNNITQNIMSGRKPTEKEFQNFINAVTPADVQNVIKKYFNFNKAALIVLHPLQEKNKNNPSFKGNIKLSDYMQPTEINLPNNIHVMFDESEDILNTTISFELISTKENKADINSLKYILKSFEEQLNNKSKSKEINTDVKISNNNFKLMLSGDSDALKDMLDIGIYELYNPKLANIKDFEKWKQENAKYTINTNDSDNEFWKDVPWFNQVATKESFTLENVQKIYKKFLSDAQMSVLITLPKSASIKHKNNILQKLSSLPAFKPYSYSEYFNANTVTPIQKNKIFAYKLENSENIIVLKDCKIIRTGNIKDLATLNVLNVLLGSKINKELRQEKEISYTANTELENNTVLPNISKLTIGAATANTTPSSNNLIEIFKSFDKCENSLQKELVTSEQLEIAKRRFKSNIFNQLETSQGRNIVLSLANNSFYGKDFLVELEKAIDNITPYDIKEIAKYYLSQPALYSISGNKESIEANKDYLKTLGEIVE